MSIENAISQAIEQERKEGIDVARHSLRHRGVELPSYTQYLLVVKRGGKEKELYLNFYPTFEVKFRVLDLPEKYVERIRREIREFGNAPDRELKRVVEIS